jgi:uncharacterized 2Fe-2S/4Fe-4S cluster protein (DUF4445 family)
MIYGDLVVFIPEESRKGNQVSVKKLPQRDIKVNPAVTECYLELIGFCSIPYRRLRANCRKTAVWCVSSDGLSIRLRSTQRAPGTVRKGELEGHVSLWLNAR